MKIYPTENILELDFIRTKGPVFRTYVLWPYYHLIRFSIRTSEILKRLKRYTRAYHCGGFSVVPVTCNIAPHLRKVAAFHMQSSSIGMIYIYLIASMKHSKITATNSEKKLTQTRNWQMEYKFAALHKISRQIEKRDYIFHGIRAWLKNRVLSPYIDALKTPVLTNWPISTSASSFPRRAITVYNTVPMGILPKWSR